MRRQRSNTRPLADSRPCEMCGVHFRPSLFDALMGKGKTCSSKCALVKAGKVKSGELPRAQPVVLTSEQRAYLSRRKAARASKTPIARRAHNAVLRAMKRGILARPTACTKCGRVGRVQGHHEDYSQPLQLVWLCSSCHLLTHSRGEMSI